jgi:hypothetical protein
VRGARRFHRPLSSCQSRHDGPKTQG